MVRKKKKEEGESDEQRERRSERNWNVKVDVGFLNFWREGRHAEADQFNKDRVTCLIQMSHESIHLMENCVRKVLIEAGYE